MLGLILGLGLALLILVLFGYAFVQCYQQGRCWRREYKERGCRAWGVGSTSCRSPKSTRGVALGHGWGMQRPRRDLGMSWCCCLSCPCPALQHQAKASVQPRG